MLELAFIYAKEVMQVDYVTLGVFTNNPIAEACYQKMGFKENEFMKNKEVEMPLKEGKEIWVSKSYIKYFI